MGISQSSYIRLSFKSVDRIGLAVSFRELIANDLKTLVSTLCARLAFCHLFQCVDI